MSFRPLNRQDHTVNPSRFDDDDGEPKDDVMRFLFEEEEEEEEGKSDMELRGEF